MVNTLRPRQNSCHFKDIFKWFVLNGNVLISLKISLKCVPMAQINNTPVLVQIMAWCRTGDKPLSELMMVNLLTHTCVTRPQCVDLILYKLSRYFLNVQAITFHSLHYLKHSFTHTVCSYFCKPITFKSQINSTSIHIWPDVQKSVLSLCLISSTDTDDLWVLVKGVKETQTSSSYHGPVSIYIVFRVWRSPC